MSKSPVKQSKDPDDTIVGTSASLSSPKIANLLPIMTPATAISPSRVIRKVLVVDPNKIRKLGLDQKIIQAVNKLKGNSPRPTSSASQHLRILSGFESRPVETSGSQPAVIVEPKRTSEEVKSQQNRNIHDPIKLKFEDVKKTLIFSESPTASTSAVNSYSRNQSVDKVNEEVCSKPPVKRGRRRKVSETEDGFHGFSSRDIIASRGHLDKLKVAIASVDITKLYRKVSPKRRRTILTAASPDSCVRIEKENLTETATNDLAISSIEFAADSNVVATSDPLADPGIVVNSIQTKCTPNSIEIKPNFEQPCNKSISELPSTPLPVLDGEKPALTSTSTLHKIQRRRNIPTAIFKLGKKPARPTVAAQQTIPLEDPNSILLEAPCSEQKSSDFSAKSTSAQPIDPKWSPPNNRQLTLIVPVPVTPCINVVAIEPINSLESPTTPPPHSIKSSNKGIVVLDQQVFKPGSTFSLPISIQLPSATTADSPQSMEKIEKPAINERKVFIKVLNPHAAQPRQVIGPLPSSKPSKPKVDAIESICRSYVKKMMKTGGIKQSEKISAKSSQPETKPTIVVDRNIDSTKSQPIHYNIRIIDDKQIVKPINATSNNRLVPIPPVRPVGISDELVTGHSVNLSTSSQQNIKSQVPNHTGIVPKDVNSEPIDAVEYILNCTLNNPQTNDATLFEGEDEIANIAWDDDDDVDDDDAVDENSAIEQKSTETDKVQNVVETVSTKNALNPVFEFEANPQVINLIENAEIAFESDIKSSPRLMTVIDLNRPKIVSQGSEPSIPNEMRIESLNQSCEKNSETSPEANSPPKKRKRTILTYMNSPAMSSINEMTERIKQRIAEKGKQIAQESNEKIAATAPTNVEMKISNRNVASEPAKPVRRPKIIPPIIRARVRKPAHAEKDDSSNAGYFKPESMAAVKTATKISDESEIVTKNVFEPSACRQDADGLESAECGEKRQYEAVNSADSVSATMDLSKTDDTQSDDGNSAPSRTLSVKEKLKAYVNKNRGKSKAALSSSSENVSESCSKENTAAAISCRSPESQEIVVADASDASFCEANNQAKITKGKRGRKKKSDSVVASTSSPVKSDLSQIDDCRRSTRTSRPPTTRSSFDRNTAKERKSFRSRKSNAENNLSMEACEDVNGFIPANHETTPKLLKSRRKNTIPEIDKLTAERRISVRSQEDLMPPIYNNASSPPQLSAQYDGGYSVMYSANFGGSVAVGSKPNIEHIFRTPSQISFTASSSSPEMSTSKRRRTTKSESTNKTKSKPRTMRLSSEVELVESGPASQGFRNTISEPLLIWQKKKEMKRKGKGKLNDYEICSKLLVATSRDEIRNAEMTIEQEAIDGVEIKCEMDLGEDSVQCGVCKLVMNEQFFAKHLKQHYGVGWRVGIDHPIDLSSYREVLCGMEYYVLRNKIEPLKCKFCGIEKKSAKGILAHILVCGATDVEIDAMMESCEFCSKRFLPHGLWTHQATCRKRIQHDAGGLDAGELPASGKRQSSIKASSSFKEILSSNTCRLKPEDLMKSYFVCIGGLSRKWRTDIKKTGRSKCNETECDFEATDVEDLKKHVKNCSYQRRGGFQCMRCQFYDLQQAKVIEHILKKHDSLLNIDLPVISKGNREETTARSMKSERHDANYEFEDCTESETSFRDDEVESSMSEASERERSKVMLPMHLFKYKQAVANHREFFVSTTDLLKEMYTEKILYPDAMPMKIVASPKSFDSFKPANTDSMKFQHIETNSVNIQVGDTLATGNWTRMESFSEQVLPGDESLIFVGGPITNCVWAPLPTSSLTGGDSHIEYLAVTYRHDFESHIKTSNPKRKETLVLIYRINTQTNKTVSHIELLYAMEYLGGPIHHIQFLPSGGYSPEKNRLGLMAIGSIEDTIKIFSLPLKVDENCDSYSSDKLCTVLRIKPSLVLCIDLSTTWERTNNEYFSQCRRIVWSEIKDHNIIAGAYLNGFIGLWDIRDDFENLTRILKNGCFHFVPLTYFKAVGYDVTGLDFHYTTSGPRWMTVSSSIRELQVYDLEDITNPKLIVQEGYQKTDIPDTVWPLYTESPHFAMGDDYIDDTTSTIARSIWNITYKTKHNIHAPSGISRLTYTPWHNVIVAACRNGDVIIQRYNSMSAVNFNNSYEKKYLLFTDIVRCDGEKIPIVNAKMLKDPVDDETLEMLDGFDRENIEKYGLVFGEPVMYYRTNKKEVLSAKRSTPFPLRPFTCINCLSICPNQSNSGLLAFGYHNGLIRIKLLDFNKFI